jgi:hypothetical protein
VLLALSAGALLAACGEHLEGGAACPVLCPVQNVTVLDTVFDPLTLDSSVAAFPSFGTEPTILLSNRGDTVDTRAVVRFDSLLAFFTTPSGDSSVTNVDSALAVLHLDRAHSKYTAPVTIEVFDVDTTESDTTVVPELQLFRPDRRIASVTFDTSQIKDSLVVRLDSARVMKSVIDRARLRLGFRATSPQPVMLQLFSAEGGLPVNVRYDASKDSTVGVVSNVPYSSVPRPVVVAQDFRDYLLVVKGSPSVSGPLLAAGGIPGRRVYLRFNIPSHILDSSTVLRATLILTQRPSPGVDGTQLLTLYPQLVTAGTDIQDVGHASLLLAPAGIGFDSLQVAPADSGVVNVEIVNAVRTWGLKSAATAQHALVLRSPDEGVEPRQLLFFSSEAAAALRPRLRISYSPRANFGIP